MIKVLIANLITISKKLLLKMENNNKRFEIQKLLEERRFLWDNISSRNQNMWTIGAFFVPISFLILAYAVTNNVSFTNNVLLALASLSNFLVFILFYLRSNKSNKIYVDRIKDIEKLIGGYGELEENIRETLRSVTIADNMRTCWLSYGFPEFVFTILWILLLILWMIFIL